MKLCVDDNEHLYICSRCLQLVYINLSEKKLDCCSCNSFNHIKKSYTIKVQNKLTFSPLFWIKTKTSP